MDDRDTNSNYLTVEGLRKAQEELDYLINVKRPEVARQIADAKSDGDVSENAGYDEAKTAQGFVEGKILTLKALISSAKVISANGGHEVVDVGSRVTVRDLKYGEEESYTIVGSTEVDPKNGRISLKSPLGRAVMGRRLGDQVEVQAPDELIRYQIIKIA